MCILCWNLCSTFSLYLNTHKWVFCWVIWGFFFFSSGGWLLQEEGLEGGGGGEVAGSHFRLWCWRESIDGLACYTLHQRFNPSFFNRKVNLLRKEMAELDFMSILYSTDCLENVLRFVKLRVSLTRPFSKTFLRQFCDLVLCQILYTENKDSLFLQYWIKSNQEYFCFVIIVKPISVAYIHNNTPKSTFSSGLKVGLTVKQTFKSVLTSYMRY